MPGRCGGDGVLDDYAVLLVLSTDLCQCAGRAPVASDELSSYGERPRRIDGATWAVVALLAHGVGIEAATRLVAHRGTLTTGAAKGAGGAARVRRQCCGDGVCLPQVHLLAAPAQVLGVDGGLGKLKM